MPRKAVYQAFLDRDAVASWLPPETMTGRVHTFGPREGGVGRCVGRCDRRRATLWHSNTVYGLFAGKNSHAMINSHAAWQKAKRLLNARAYSAIRSRQSGRLLVR